MYQALYRKWRPMTFDDVVGQEHITETLKNQVKNGRLSHAYLFVGTRGTGKTTCAKILSRAVNCLHPVDGNPCNECAACRGILDGSVMDVVEMDAASNNGVDNVRALRDEAVFSPAEVRRRVYIVDEVHMLSASAFNALLKILEEPPEHLMFILPTTELNKVPATILSRCQRYSFRRIDQDVIASRLSRIAEGEGIRLEPDAAGLLAHLAEGSMRDAVSLLDQCSGLETVDREGVLASMGLAGAQRTADLAELVAAGDAAGAMDCFEALWRDGKEPAALLDELCSLYRDIMMMKIAPKHAGGLLSGGDGERVRSLAGRISMDELLADLTAVQAAQAEGAQSLDPRVTAEVCIVRLCSPELMPGGALEARVARLEQAFASGRAPSAVQSRPAHAQSAESAPVRGTEPHRERVPEPERPPWDDEPPAEEEPPLPEEPPEPGPEPEEAGPEPETEQQAQAAPAGADPGLWKALLAELKGKMAIGPYNMISDPFHAEGVSENGGLVIYIKNSFAMNVLNAPAVVEAVKSAASAVSGGAAVPVRVVEGAPDKPEPGRNSLDALSRFGNVKFE